MADREKVVYGLKCITGKLFPVPAVTCPTCHYTGSGEDFDDCVMAIAEDALELLEEQEPEKVEYIWACPKCGSQLILKTSKICKAIGLSIDKCPVCGEKVRYGKVN